MIQFIKRLKFTYALYNFFHRKELIHNETSYNKLGLNKKYYSSISSRDFSGLPAVESLRAQINEQKLASCSLFHQLTADDKKSLLSFEDQGFAVIRNYLSSGQVDLINAEIDTLINTKKIHFNRSNKIMFAIRSSALLRNLGDGNDLKEILSVLIGGKAVLFQSINFLMGSEQATHSDSIHMTTYPLGGLLGVWIALEDTTIENGPLHYYPGSHKLPYYLNGDYDNEGNAFLLGKKSYSAYENMIQEKIREQKLEKVVFLARKGDLLIWHANLFHGGEPHINKEKTRKSLVFHYFKEGAVCYHEISQRPALIRKKI